LLKIILYLSYLKNKFILSYLKFKQLFSMEDKSVSKKKHLNLQYVNRMMTTCFYLNKYNPFSRNFNNITMWLNLTNVNLSNNMITMLPSAFGKLRLNRLDLSQNRLGIFDSTRWSWIKQNTIENTLFSLNISNNSVSDVTSWNIISKTDNTIDSIIQYRNI